MAFAFVRCVKLGVDEVMRMGVHARGVDAAADRRRRPDATHRAVSWDEVHGEKVWPVPPPLEEDGEGKRVRPDAPPSGPDYDQLLSEHLARHNAKMRKGATATLHMIVGISPSTLKALGNPHNPDDPAVRKILREVREWGEREIGGVWAVRYDLDERGCAVVDLFASPLRANKRSGRVAVSARQALKELAHRYKRSGARSYSALQDSWVEHARRTIDSSIERGLPIEVTGREHVSSEAWGDTVEASIAAAEADAAAEMEAAAAARQAAEDERAAAQRQVAASARQAAAAATEMEAAAAARGG